MRNKVLTIFAVLVVVALAASVSYAERPFFGKMGYGGPGHWGPPALTEEQRTKLAELRKEFDKETATLRQEVRQKRLELAAIMAGPNPDEAKAIAKMKELSAAREKLAEKGIQFRIKNRDFFAQLPQFGRGFGPRYGHPMGPGYGPHMMGPGYGPPPAPGPQRGPMGVPGWRWQ
jgi:Spy/CpxP family protein refolding chaperone